ncbi:MAG: 50S ribosomal protein L13 [bacterium]|nr:50S ribosomal protein L13 [bacterium]
MHINADGKIVGRLASEIARMLLGKQNPSARPNAVVAEDVVVMNTDKMRVTGRKMTGKIYYRHSGYIGNLKEESLESLFKRDSREVLRRAVSGMLPKNKLRNERLKKLKMYHGEK